jgi:hypothetical protein
MKRSFSRGAIVCCLVGAFAVGGLLGCGDDETPADKCNALVNSLCARAVTCGFYASVSACRVDMASMNCAAAIGVSTTYDACMSQVPSVDCTAFSGGSSLPTACLNVILMPG